MKFVLSVIVTVSIFLSTPMSVLALDIDCGGGPEDYLTTYLDNRDYSILQVTVLETIETSQSSDAFETGLYDRVSQRVAVNQVVQGTATSIEWLYFDMDPIWGYSCQDGHVADGESAIYVVYERDTLQKVVNVYQEDSPGHAKIISHFADIDFRKPAQITSARQAQDLARDISRLTYDVRTLLREFRFWMDQTRDSQ